MATNLAIDDQLIEAERSSPATKTRCRLSVCAGRKAFKALTLTFLFVRFLRSVNCLFSAWIKTLHIFKNVCRWSCSPLRSDGLRRGLLKHYSVGTSSF
jgi:hypothetical protein